MAFTADDLAKLDKAIADGRGARTIVFSDKSVTFETIKEMKERRALMAQSANPGGYRNFRLGVTGKGT